MTRKQVCYLMGWHRSTLRRHERAGLPFACGFTTYSAILWFLGQRDDAKRCGIALLNWLAMSAAERARLLDQT